MNRIIGTASLHLGDCLEVLRSMAENSVDSIVTDPPYGLNFMGKKWDYDVPSVEIWSECLRVLKPGGSLLAFAGTRTQHRMACRIEDAGFEIRDMIAWVYSSGFPKSHNGEWGGTALKPALEPITMARKPLIGTVAANVAAHGTGGLNIDACRVPTSDKLGGGGEKAETSAAFTNEGWRRPWMDDPEALERQAATVRANVQKAESLGRWPANLIHDGSADVVSMFPQSAGQQGDVRGTEPSSVTNGIYGDFAGRFASPARNDTGSAARFFYCAKASRADRNDGVEHLNKKPLNWSSGTQNPGSFQSEGTDKSSQNNHPTVKPTDLMAYLCRLVTPAGGIVLDPFMGSGSTGRAAGIEQFKFIGIEINPEYFEIACLRIDSATAQQGLEFT